jgi:hypothetical protein
MPIEKRQTAAEKQKPTRLSGGTMKKPTPLGVGFSVGAGEESRTPDLRITNALLYQLSYTGKDRHYIVNSKFHGSLRPHQ